MNISRENLLDRWKEVSGFALCRLLEDNQRLSLPMITMTDRGPMILAFIYSCQNGKATVSQQHLWDMDEHHMMLCKTVYDLDLSSAIAVDRDLYVEKLTSAFDSLFKDNLTDADRLACKEYFAAFGNPTLLRMHLSENRPLLSWVVKQNLL